MFLLTNKWEFQTIIHISILLYDIDYGLYEKIIHVSLVHFDESFAYFKNIVFCFL